MNELIRELAEQAWDATAVSPEFGHPVSFAEKFAELIIKECRNVCVKQSIYYAEQGKMRESGAAGACGRLIDIALGVEK